MKNNDREVFRWEDYENDVIVSGCSNLKYALKITSAEEKKRWYNSYRDRIKPTKYDRGTETNGK